MARYLASAFARSCQKLLVRQFGMTHASAYELFLLSEIMEYA